MVLSGPGGSVSTEGAAIRGKPKRGRRGHGCSPVCGHNGWPSHTSRARDLAEAYHYLDYYGRVYGDIDPDARGSREWSPVLLIEQLARTIVELGGDPKLVEPRTDYMRAGVSKALAPTTAPV
jgi:hypothetical protein